MNWFMKMILKSLELNSIDGGDIMFFNETNVIGDFNNDGFILFLEDVGDHDYVFISFDLYIHGSWDGNFNGFTEDDKPLMGDGIKTRHATIQRS